MKYTLLLMKSMFTQHATSNARLVPKSKAIYQIHHSAFCTYNALFTDQCEQYNTSYSSNNTNWQHYFDLWLYWCSRCSWLPYIPAIRTPISWLPASRNDCIKYEMLGGLVSYLHYLCVFAYSGVRHIVFCVFVLFVFVVSTLCFSGLFFFDCPFGIL
jgi:hypothetical protein